MNSRFRYRPRLVTNPKEMLLVEHFAKTALAISDHVYMRDCGHVAVEEAPEKLRKDERGTGGISGVKFRYTPLDETRSKRLIVLKTSDLAVVDWRLTCRCLPG